MLRLVARGSSVFLATCLVALCFFATGAFQALPLSKAYAASAVDGAVTGIVVTEDHMSLYTSVKVDVSWHAPAGTQPEDFFSVTLPDEFEFINTSFDIVSEDGQDLPIAHCVVVGQTVTCTFTDYVSSYIGTSGTFSIWVKAVEEFSGGDMVWLVNGSTVYYPGPVIGPPTTGSFPSKMAKGGWLANYEGNQVIAWEMLIPSSKLSFNGAPVVLTDTLDPGLDYYRSEDDFLVGVQYADEAEWYSRTWTAMTRNTDFQASVNSLDHSFTLSFNDTATVREVLQGTYAVRVLYRTRPYLPTEGKEYSNTIRATSGDTSSSVVTWYGGGGSGGGSGADVTLRKSDGVSGALLGGTEFKLTLGSDGNGLTIADHLVTDQSGEIKIHQLLKGTYSFVETGSVEGYAINPEPLPFLVTDESGEEESPLILNFANSRLPGSVSWQKVDSLERFPIAGSEWILSGPDGFLLDVVDNGVHDDDPVIGQMKVSGIAWGTYRLVEEAAPAGYVLEESFHDFEIGPTSLEVSLGEIDNARSSTAVSVFHRSSGNPAAQTGGVGVKTGDRQAMPVILGLAAGAAGALTLASVGLAWKRREN